MKTVRHSLFETNSSAMHSITIQDVKDKSNNDFDFVIDNGILRIDLKSYTHDPKLLFKPSQKLNYYLSYLLTNLQNYIDFSKYKDYEGHVDFAKVKLDKANTFLEYSENTFDIHMDNGVADSVYLYQLNVIKEILTEKYHCKIVLTGDPHVSHRANGIIEKFIGIISTENVKNFLLNPDVIIVIDSSTKKKYSNQFTNESGYFFGDELETNRDIDRDATFNRLDNILHNSIISQLKLDYSKCFIKFGGLIVDDKIYDVTDLICFPQNGVLFFKKLGKFELLDFSYDRNQKIRSIVIQRDKTEEIPLHHHDLRIKSDKEHAKYFLEFYRWCD